jgi:DNA polymerase-3 subunit gamma/tau
MENFIVSARKYRPAAFDMVIGQGTITNTLQSAIKNNKLAHAYLFCGPRGVGKTTCARIFAKAINCEKPGPNGEACEECESCKSFNSSRSFNIHELDAASNNSVDDIRNLNDQVRIPPQIGKYSIYIIDEVHMLSSSAFNAFLKTLEEPPAHAIFILATTEKHKIIPTILSRCQIFDFNRIRIEDIVARLVFVAKKEGINAEEEALHIIAQKADGAMRDALSIFDQIVSLSGKNITYRDVISNLNVLDYEYYFRTIDGALAGDVSSVLLTFNEVLEKGFDGHNFISGLNSHLRDLLVCRDESTLKLLEATPAIKQRYLQQTSRCPVDFLFRALETGSNCDLTYKNSKNPRLNVELSLIRLCNLVNGSSAEPEKKKPDSGEIRPAEPASVVPEPEIRATEKKISPIQESVAGKHIPVVEKPSRTFSIKDLISEDAPSYEKPEINNGEVNAAAGPDLKDELTPELFEAAWAEFTGQLQGEGPRITSMFRSVRPEFENANTVKIHLSNATQKDTFVLNYKQRLMNFLESRFRMRELEIETAIDTSESDQILYTDEQKSAYLFNKYPVLKEMKKTFNLDIP